jgi:hypothetical protein
MSRSKWRKLRRFSSAYIAEAKARAGKGFTRGHPRHKPKTRAGPLEPLQKRRSTRLKNRTGRMKMGGLRGLFRRPIK